MDDRDQRYIIKILAEKSQELSKRFAYEMTKFLKQDIYIAITPDGYNPTTKPPKQAHYYKIGGKYVAWATYPGLRFDYVGEVICVNSWWEEVYYGEPGTKIIGWRPRGQFRTLDGRRLNPLHTFITTIETKNLVDKTLEDFMAMDIKELKT